MEHHEDTHGRPSPPASYHRREESLPYPTDLKGYGGIPDPRHFQTQPPSSSTYSYEPRTRSRATSDARWQEPYQRAPPPAQPIYDAVNSAFDHSSAAHQLPHDVIAQITEQVRSQVIDSLRAEGVAAVLQQQQSQQRTSERASDSPQMRPVASQNRDTSIPPQPLHTPPHVDRQYTEAFEDEANDFDKTSAYISRTNTKSSLGTEGLSGSATGEGSLGKSLKDDVHEPGKIDLSGRLGDRSDESKSRPQAAVRAMTDEEETIVERMWQPLFRDGKPTPRLSQFLRGLALHLIEDFEPKRSMVISPQKMLMLYRATKIASESYDWAAIFTRISPASLSRVYRDLKCEHHFIQDTSIPTSQINTDTPSIPALTPNGFATWMTMLIQADPSAEFERLSVAVRNMPISNPDDRKERWPKELSRRLLPKSGNAQIRMQCSAALSAEGQVPQLQSRQTSFPPPPPPPVGERTRRSSFTSKDTSSATGADMRRSATTIERERKPYSRMPGTDNHGSETRDSAFAKEASDINASRDNPGSAPTHAMRESHKPSVQIERERKPYVAQEGLGKVYETTSNEETSSHHRPTETRHESYPQADTMHSSLPSRSYSKSGRRPRSPVFNPHVRSDGSLNEARDEYYDKSRMYGDDLEHEHEADRRRHTERHGQYVYDDYPSAAHRHGGYNDYDSHSSRHGSVQKGYSNAPLGSGERRYG